MKNHWMSRARSLAVKMRASAPRQKPAARVEIAIAAEAPTAAPSATLYIYEQIGRDWWTGEGCTAKDVVDAIAEAKKSGAKSLAVRILSEGGDAFDGLGIHEALKRCGMKTTAYNDGLCASAATMVALGCDNLVAAPTSTFMCHRAWSMAVGNEEDMRSMADLLAKLDGTIADVYSQKSGKSREECLAMMSAGSDGTWMTAEECKDFGLADEIASVESPGAEIDDDGDEAMDAVLRLVNQTGRRIAAATRERLNAKLSQSPRTSPGASGQPVAKK